MRHRHLALISLPVEAVAMLQRMQRVKTNPVCTALPILVY